MLSHSLTPHFRCHHRKKDKSTSEEQWWTKPNNPFVFSVREETEEVEGKGLPTHTHTNTQTLRHPNTIHHPALLRHNTSLRTDGIYHRTPSFWAPVAVLNQVREKSGATGLKNTSGNRAHHILQKKKRYSRPMNTLIFVSLLAFIWKVHSKCQKRLNTYYLKTDCNVFLRKQNVQFMVIIICWQYRFRTVAQSNKVLASNVSVS